MGYGGLNGDVINDVTWPWKVKVVIPESFKDRYLENSLRQRLGYNRAPIVNGVRGIEWSRDW